MDMKIKDVAEMLNVSEATIRRWVKRGIIPTYQIHKQFHFSRIEITDWIMRHRLGKAMDDIAKARDKKTEEIPMGGVKQYSFYRALHKGDVLHHVPGKTKEEVIRRVMQYMAKNLQKDADGLTNLLMDREYLMPTALNHGIAVPHTRDFLLKEHYDIVVVAYPEEPIEYGALDGLPVHTLFFLFACEDKRHLNLLAKIAHLSSDARALSYLQTQPQKEQLLEFIKAWESSAIKSSEN